MTNTVPNYYFGIDGKGYDSDTNDVYAKKQWNGRYYEYYIRAATTGPDVPHLLNPWGMHFQVGVDDQRFEAFLNKRRYEYRKVNVEVFDIYISFLKSRNDLYYRAAERMLD